MSLKHVAKNKPPQHLTLTVLVATTDAQWEGMGDVRSARVRAGTTSPMPNHKGFKLQQLVNFQKFSTLRVNCNSHGLLTNSTVHLYKFEQATLTEQMYEYVD